MRDRKTIILFICAFLVIGVIFISELNFPSLATDSGFDVSYGSGGGSSSGSGGSSGVSSGSSSSSGTGNFFLDIIVSFIFFFIVIFFCYIISVINSFLKKKNIASRVGFVFISVFLISVISIPFIFFGIIAFSMPNLVIQNSILLIVFVSWLFLFITVTKNLYQTYAEGIKLEIKKSKVMKTIRKAKKRNSTMSEYDRNLLQKGYEIYLDVQNAWMNFDYEALRKLVTDDLFNMYQNQLQTLELKGQQNIMEQFKLKESYLASSTLENGIKTTEMILKVAFFDYIINKDKKVVRGRKSVKVVMTYLLTFISHEGALENCPHCGAKLKNSATVCEYCNSNIQWNNSGMKLSKKEVINQEME